MADIDAIPGCCGITELMYIRDDETPEDSLMSFESQDIGAHVIFSVTSRQTPKHAKGHALAKLIKDAKLGAVIMTPRGAVNPGHTGTIKAWLWTPNKTALKRWQAKKRKENPDKYGDTLYGDPYYNGYW